MRYRYGMDKYVTTLVFDQSLERIALIKKNRGPSNIIGKWTAIGGHIEESEDVLSAAIREVKEESGLEIFPIHFAKITRLFGNVEICYNIGDFYNLETKTDEEVSWFRILDILVPSPYARLNFSADLGWLVLMALNYHNKTDTSTYIINGL